MANDDLDEGLLDHLAIEFLDYGQRAVDFLRSASALLSTAPADVPRVANTVAYCIREAMDSILKSQDAGHGGQWGTRSRAVVEAKRRLELTRGLPGEDSDAALHELLARIDDMELSHQEESIHQKRLIAVGVKRMGVQPLVSGVEPVRVYQDLLSRVNVAVHGAVTIDEIRGMWSECLAILRQLFLPPEVRNRELDELAAVENPGPADVAKLVTLLAGPNHLRYFLSKTQTPAWLSALADTDLLEPPTSQAPWPVFAAVEQLKDGHGDEVASVLSQVLDRWGSHQSKAWYVARAALDLATSGQSVLLAVLKKHPGLSVISNFGILAAGKADPAGDFVESVADTVLNSNTWDAASLYPEPLLRALVNGINAENGLRRVTLLCYKLGKIPPDNNQGRRYFDLEIGEYLDTVPEYRKRAPFYALLQALLDLLKRASESATVADLLQAMSPLPDEIADRVHTWLLGNAVSVECQDMIINVARAIESRRPNGDDVRLVERVLAECDASEYDGPWTDALGEPPGVTELGSAMAAGQVPDEWRRAFYWSGVLPPSAAAAWDGVVGIMSAPHGPPPSREAFARSPSTELLSYGQSPLTESDMRAMQPEDAARWIAAWRPDPSQWLVSARELGRTLQAVVKDDPAAWAARPLATATLLRHPTYIGHYVQGLADAESLDGVPVDELLDLMSLIRTHPWEAVGLGDDTFDFDPDWRGAELSSIDLIKSMAQSDIGFGARNDEVWAVLQAEIENQSEPSGVEGSKLDPLETAINRPSTRALEAALFFLGHEYRLNSTVRPAAIDLLTSLLTIEGRQGAECRAILASRLGFLRHSAPDWVELHRDELFGTAAPGGLGQLTVDLAVKWGRVNSWLLERYPAAIRNAVERRAEHALEHYLIGMLWSLPGYAVDETVRFLHSKGLLPAAGGALGRLLRQEDVPADQVDLAVQFWAHALQVGKPDSLFGFGWFAEVQDIDTGTWFDLTLQTVIKAEGRIDWAHKVAERAVALQPHTTRTLAILNELVRGLADEWDRHAVTELAARTIKQASHLGDSPEYKRLHTTLVERGALEYSEN